MGVEDRIPKESSCLSNHVSSLPDPLPVFALVSTVEGSGESSGEWWASVSSTHRDYAEFVFPIEVSISFRLIEKWWQQFGLSDSYAVHYSILLLSSQAFCAASNAFCSALLRGFGGL